MKPLLLLAFLLLSGLARNLEYDGVMVTYRDLAGEERMVPILREFDPECYDVALAPETIWGGAMAHPEVPAECKRDFVISKGGIQPMEAAPGVETYGELEVLEFLQTQVAIHPDQYVLVDSRSARWYEQRTIPGAVNVLVNLEPPETPALDSALEKLGVGLKDGEYDFSNAKTALLFCNAVWCAQSRLTILTLLEMGYPEEKLKWYRGGMQSWLSLGLTTVTP